MVRLVHHLIGVYELSLRWGISRQRVHALHDEGKIPPGTPIGHGNRRTIVWELTDIEEHERQNPDREVVNPGPYHPEG